ncbi:PD-(D/E)XK nuclease superfamily protein [Methanocella sp. MCL-LM]|uniref:PD-(D/E)XK nuclease superfamily protein n=1 Tax=Methanocella sp. MCL-LM TaxID=3412035 RepID=UPI003C75C8E1
MSEIINQGGYANTGGKTLEKAITGLLTSKGFQEVPYRIYNKNPSRFGTEVLLRDAPYKTIYNHNGKTEFKLISEKHKLSIRIECKWQQSGGSVDEKFPYLYLNCIEAMPEKDIIIIYGGKGAKQGAIDWLKKSAKDNKYMLGDTDSKNIQVMDLEEFFAWANKTFR